MSRTSQIAYELFHSGYNCAQSVLLSFSDILNYSPDTLEAITLGFGGGMGRLQKTCGALTGAFMVIGLYATQTSDDPDDREEWTRKLIRECHLRFLAEHHKSDCIELTGHDINTEAGRNMIIELDIKEKICSPCVISATHILNELLNRGTT